MRTGIVIHCNILYPSIRSMVLEIANNKEELVVYFKGDQLQKASTVKNEIWKKAKKLMDQGMSLTNDTFEELFMNFMREISSTKTIAFVNDIKSQSELDFIRSKIELRYPFYHLYASNNKIEESIFKEWNNENSHLKKYNYNLAELEQFTLKILKLKASHEKFALESKMYEKINVSNFSKSEIKKLVVDIFNRDNELI